MRPGHLTLGTVLLSAALVACGSSGSSGSTTTAPPGPSPQLATVGATAQLAFSPNSVTIAPGGTVTFVFGTVAHTVKFDTGTNPPADILGSNANTSISRTFNTAGTFTFHCIIHPQMTGTVIVAASSTTTNPAPPPGYGP
jgi:plastocyanin